MRKSHFVLLLLPAVVGLVPVQADASASVRLTLAELAGGATLIARVTPLDATSAWENGRIVTTTRARVEDRIAGAGDHGAIVAIRSWGGTVGGVGQIVEGEPSFRAGAPAIVFLSARPEGAFFVVGRAQGELVIERRGDVEIVRTVHAGALVPRAEVRGPLLARSGPPIGALDRATRDQATAAILAAWEVSHAR